MTFQANIPLATDFISVSQSDLIGNFQSLSTAWQVDHVNFNASGAGEHKKVSLLAPIGDPGLATPKASLYTKASSVTTTSDLYYQDGALASNVKQITGGGITAAAWCTFNGPTVTLGQNYNIASISFLVDTFTLTFTRAFANTTYLADIRVTGSFSTQLCTFITATNTANCTFKLLQNGVPFTGSAYVTAIFFGTLA